MNSNLTKLLTNTSNVHLTVDSVSSGIVSLDTNVVATKTALSALITADTTALKNKVLASENALKALLSSGETDLKAQIAAAETALVAQVDANKVIVNNILNSVNNTTDGVKKKLDDLEIGRAHV